MAEKSTPTRVIAKRIPSGYPTELFLKIKFRKTEEAKVVVAQAGIPVFKREMIVKIFYEKI